MIQRVLRSDSTVPGIVSNVVKMREVVRREQDAAARGKARRSKHRYALASIPPGKCSNGTHHRILTYARNFMAGTT